MATPDVVTGPINVGNPGEFTMRELASMVIEITGSRSRIVHRALPADWPIHFIIRSLWLWANSRHLICLPKAQDNTCRPV